MSETKTLRSGLRFAALGVIYAIGLVLSALFVIPIFVAEQLLPSRTKHHGERYGYTLPGRIGMIALDVSSVASAYWLGDYLRCRLYQHTSWPEIVPDFGPTLRIHVQMMVLVAVVWPLILYLMGWYAERWRSWGWRVRNTVASMAVVGMTIAAGSLLIHRDIYPRAQIGFAVAARPLPTAAIRVLGDLIVRLGRGSPLDRPPADEAW